MSTYRADERRAAVRVVACPTCGSPKGASCQTGNEARYYPTTTHKKRVDLYYNTAYDRVAATKEPSHEQGSDPLHPNLTLLVKLGSIAVHADEALSANGHEFDIAAMKPILNDPQVKQWIKDMGVYLPVKR